MPEVQRMRNRFYKEGLDNFEPHEVLEMILDFSVPRCDTNALAHDLIERFGGFHETLDASCESLRVAGLDDDAVLLIKIIPSLLGYYINDRENGTPCLATSNELGKYAVSRTADDACEIFAVMTLTSQMHLINFEVLAERKNVSVCAVAESALRNGASNVVLVQKRMSGSLFPSRYDCEFVAEISEILEPLGVRLKDYILILQERFSSLAELKRMKSVRLNDESSAF